MNHIEDTLRDAVRELADDAPRTYGLADVARQRGRRLRRRRRVALVTGAAALVAATITPYAVVHRAAPPAPVAPSPPVPTVSAIPGQWWTSPYRLPGGAVVTALSKVDVGLVDAPVRKTVQDGNVLLDPATGHYVVLPSAYYTVYGSPRGGHALALNGEGGSGVVDAVGGRGIWMDLSPMGPQWSSDGTKILLTGLTGFSIMDAATGKITDHPIGDFACPDECFFTWLPGEREVAIARRDPGVAHDEAKRDPVKDIAVFSVSTGKPTRTVPVAGAPIGPDAWSADGRLVLTYDPAAHSKPIRIADVGTGRILGQIPGTPHFLPDGRILSLSEGKATLYDRNGKALEAQTLPADFKNREISLGTS
ncbi:TolB family protein [Paractinoplanes durhamensis]|uniref:WD40 repeat domain-containing protein n=1 Tax=Paractinoplanes durhamensis TaxID=113563 RepID=A0ABQ3Z6E7_9ACTN|nr:hypothetical protein [Actinoplanes durhamensis]GIE05346.1 hypothetical protein Adu01nite_66960 [Actinoplanes durhamensis]